MRRVIHGKDNGFIPKPIINNANPSFTKKETRGRLFQVQRISASYSYMSVDDVLLKYNVDLTEGGLKISKTVETKERIFTVISGKQVFVGYLPKVIHINKPLWNGKNKR